MKKSILNLAGAQELTKKEQKSVSGGIKISCSSQKPCTGTPPPGTHYACIGGYCVVVQGV